MRNRSQDDEEKTEFMKSVQQDEENNGILGLFLKI